MILGTANLKTKNHGKFKRQFKDSDFSTYNER